MNVRDAVEADLDAVTAIYAESVLHGTATFEIEPPSRADMGARFRAVAAHDLPWLVADRDGQVVGYGYVSVFRPRPGYRFTVEDSIYLAPEARGAGVGRALLVELIARCRSRGLRHVIAAIGDSANAASIGLHRTCGFRDAGRYHQVGYKFERWLDVVFMQLDLSPDGAPPTTAGLSL